MSPSERGRGRPAKSPDERKAVRNITLDADLLTLMHQAQSIIEKRIGFTPTLSQTVRCLLNDFIQSNTTEQKK